MKPLPPVPPVAFATVNDAPPFAPPPGNRPGAPFCVVGSARPKFGAAPPKGDAPPGPQPGSDCEPLVVPKPRPDCSPDSMIWAFWPTPAAPTTPTEFGDPPPPPVAVGADPPVPNMVEVPAVP